MVEDDMDTCPAVFSTCSVVYYNNPLIHIIIRNCVDIIEFKVRNVRVFNFVQVILLYT